MTVVTLALLIASPGRAETSPVAAPVAPSRRPLDYTAWSMAPGEVRVGLTRFDVGVLPRVRVGTQTGLLALGAYNVAGQWSPVDSGPLGVAVGGAFHEVPLGDFRARHSRLDLTLSHQLDRLGLHGTVAWTRLQTDGHPDPTKLSPVVLGLLGTRGEELQGALGQDGLDLESRIDTARLALAADVQLSEHHALVSQLGLALAQDKAIGAQVAEVGDAVGMLAETLDPDDRASPSDSYVASFAWQGSWRHLQVRAGLGLSADPYAWLLPSTELSWRFGGERRATVVDDALVDDAVVDGAVVDDAS